MFSNEGMVDLGLAERIEVTGRGSVQKISKEQFCVTYWVLAPDHNGLWVRAPRLYLIRPISSVQIGTPFWEDLSRQSAQSEVVLLS